ncbi:hypothetical protein RJ40_05380 [Methanofollis aquaemaris]|uniref:Uncharacterized protein n=1 Tax=Methanofollis aquaemaris TaxID=126734 RepID=A0A8A3S4W7_9EURY|nr:hypothetical protein [Methanofollis aquaemaris]QSZ66963.1 hypothetical protein RJ40_05380 [Methanofollis aquaemaris]
MNRGQTQPQDRRNEMSWSFARKIKGDGLDCGKIVQGEEAVRTFIGEHAEVIPPADAVIDRLKKYDPLA